MHSPSARRDERRLATAVLAWLLLAGVCVAAANAWAMGAI